MYHEYNTRFSQKQTPKENGNNYVRRLQSGASKILFLLESENLEKTTENIEAFQIPIKSTGKRLLKLSSHLEILYEKLSEQREFFILGLVKKQHVTSSEYQLLTQTAQAYITLCNKIVAIDARVTNLTRSISKIPSQNGSVKSLLEPVLALKSFQLDAEELLETENEEMPALIIDYFQNYDVRISLVFRTLALNASRLFKKQNMTRQLSKELADDPSNKRKRKQRANDDKPNTNTDMKYEKTLKKPTSAVSVMSY